MMRRGIGNRPRGIPIIGFALGIGLSVVVGTVLQAKSDPIPVCGTWGVASPPRGMATTPEAALLNFSAEAAETSLNSADTELDRWRTHAASARIAVVDTVAEDATSFILKDASGTITARYTAVRIDGMWGIEEFWHTMPDAFCAAK